MEGLRIPLVHAITGISEIKLIAARKQVRQGESPPTRTATSVFAYLNNSRTHKPQSLMHLSTLAIFYLNLEKLNPRLHRAELFLCAWQSRKFIVENLDSIDINAAWYAIQGTKSQEVIWRSCKFCDATFICTTKASAKPKCPFCQSHYVKIVEP